MTDEQVTPEQLQAEEVAAAQTQDTSVVDVKPATAPARGRIAEERIYAEHPQYGRVLVAAKGARIPDWYTEDGEIDYERSAAVDATETEDTAKAVSETTKADGPRQRGGRRKS